MARIGPHRFESCCLQVDISRLRQMLEDASRLAAQARCRLVVVDSSMQGRAASAESASSFAVSAATFPVMEHGMASLSLAKNGLDVLDSGLGESQRVLESAADACHEQLEALDQQLASV